MRIFARLKSAVSDYVQGAVQRNVLEIFGSQGSRPLTKRNELVRHYTSWAYICGTRNGMAMAEVPLRLYATRSSTQQRAGEKWGERCGKTITQKQHDYLAKNPTVSSSAAFKESVEIEEIFVHPLLKLVNHPNDFMAGFEMRSLTSIFLDMSGDGYWWVPPGPMATGDQTRPENLWILPSQAVTIVPDKTGDNLVKEYKYGRRSFNKLSILPRDMVHHKFPSPLSILHGYAPAEAVIMSIIWDESMDIYENALNKNMARPEGMLTFEQDVTEAERKALQNDINTQQSGVWNVGKTIVGGKNAKWSTMAWSPKEMAALRGRAEAMKKIANAFGVPLSLIETKDVNKANAETGLVVYARFTIKPRLRMMEEKMNNQLVPTWDDTGRLFFAYDNPVPEDREFELLVEESHLKSGVITINEVRTRDGSETVEWGDVPLISNTIAPLGSTSAVSPQAGKASGTLEPVAAKTHNGSLGGCKCCGPDTLIIKADGAAEIDRELTGGPNPAPDSPERKLRAIINDMLGEQETDALGQPVDTVELDSDKYAAKYVPLALPIIAGVTLRSGNAALRATRIAVFPWFEAEAVQTGVESFTVNAIKNVSDVLNKQFTATVAQGLADGEGLPALSKRIADVFAGTEREKRALMIARTETARAQTLGQTQAWEQSGVVTAKIWDSLDDACPFCLGMDGRVVSLDTNFWNEGDTMNVEFDGRNTTLGMNYADVDGPPLHPSCRCSLRAVTSKPE